MITSLPANTMPGGKISRLPWLLGNEDAITVLLVEDSKTIRTQLRQYIGQLENVTLIETTTMAEARAVLEAQHKTLFCAILDLTLPDADGLEIVDLVRSFKVPIIVLTGSMDPFLRQAVLDLRVIDYMFKTGNAAIEEVAYLVGRLRQNQSTKVMIVDDSNTYRMHLSGLLQQYRFPIIAACNGPEALQLLDQHPDTALILTDYFMPGMNGLELIRRIRRQYRREDLAIIALSDLQRPELSAAMLKAGANDFLTKGFQAEEFYCRMLQNANMVNFVRELREMANRDYLTRLHNRRYLFQAGEALHEEALAGERHIALAIIDIDFFKRINDRHGHGGGDEALRKIAAVLRRNFSRDEIVVRYGGEEFVCIARLKSPGEIADRFEKLRAEIEAIDLLWNRMKICITASIGVTTTLGITLAEMIEQADQAVFQAKSEGRNRVVVL